MGKTTLLRDIARLLSLTPEEGGLGRKVIIVDTSNEIAGELRLPPVAQLVLLYMLLPGSWLPARLASAQACPSGFKE